MPKGKIHSIETMGLVDGPGIRTVLFFQGCRLRCQYCHNPDTWQLDSGKEMDVQQLVSLLKRYRPYYGATGGVTCSGGEPLLQATFLTELFRACKKENIPTCLDTAGYGNGDYGTLLAYTDLVIFDVKHYRSNDYTALTGGDIAVPNVFLQAVINSGKPLWVRHVVVPGLTDSPPHIKRLGHYLRGIPNIQKIELLPYHTLGINKYAQMGFQCPLQGTLPMDKDETRKLQQMLTETIFTEKGMKHDDHYCMAGL
ncbi:pyruvate formate-lyase-activating protein [Oscillospiraceae bacterium LTW-04]|nr:pyruvate formate-lyase-activating protein [Oscillospiraceae bacterium MB24-C1]